MRQLRKRLPTALSAYNFNNQKSGKQWKQSNKKLRSQNKENKLQANSNTLPESTIGLDDIELNQEGEVVECSENICGANGQCFTHGGESYCCCKPGYVGGNCERKLSPCEVAASLDPLGASLCKNDAICVDNMAEFDYKCMCKPGYTGQNCEIEINECDSNPCQNNGQCFDQIGTYKCSCQSLESPGSQFTNYPA